MASSGNPAPRASWKALGLDFIRPLETTLKTRAILRRFWKPKGHFLHLGRRGSAVSRSAVKAYPGAGPGCTQQRPQQQDGSMALPWLQSQRALQKLPAMDSCAERQGTRPVLLS